MFVSLQVLKNIHPWQENKKKMWKKISTKMMMKMTTSKFVFKLCLSLVCHFVSPGLSFQPEFVRSFLTRPWMLSNQSLNDPITGKNHPYSQWARKLKKNVQGKKLVKYNKSISRRIFLTKFHFLRFQKWPKINFWTRKKS